MASTKSHTDAFYKDAARASAPYSSLRGLLPRYPNPALTVGILFVSTTGLAALIIIAGVRFHTATLNAKETHTLIQDNIAKTNMLYHQVMDVLTPLFKVIGDEVGVSLPQKLTEIRQFILTKTNFFNPNREFDFRELHWCINPPDKVKVNFSTFCESIGINEGLHLISNPYREDYDRARRPDIFPAQQCANGMITKGLLVEVPQSLTTIARSRKGSVIDMQVAFDDGVYGKTFRVLVDPDRGDGPLVDQRVFEIGLIRKWVDGKPYLHMTNYIYFDSHESGTICTLAVGEFKLAALCFGERVVDIARLAHSGGSEAYALTMEIFGVSHHHQRTEVTSVTSGAVNQVYIGSHRGVVKGSYAYWAVPARGNITDSEWPDCLSETCRSRSLPFCNQTVWRPFNDSIPANYGLLILDISIHHDLSVYLEAAHGPLLLEGFGLDVYRGTDSLCDWLTIPPRAGSSLGTINRVCFNGTVAIIPHTLSYSLGSTQSSCYVPIQPPYSRDQHILVESNLVVLPTTRFSYISATYDTSRSEHAIVYYIYNPSRGSSYIFPFRLQTKGSPLYLRIECFTWFGSIWCLHAFEYIGDSGIRQSVHEAMVHIDFQCPN